MAQERYNTAEKIQSMVTQYTKAARPVGRPKSAIKREEGKISADVDKELLTKVREISRTNGVSIRDIFEASLSLYIDAYEAKHGKIKVNSCRCDSAKDLI